MENPRESLGGTHKNLNSAKFGGYKININKQVVFQYITINQLEDILEEKLIYNGSKKR